MLVSRKSSGSEADALMVMKFWLIMAGIYIWEFVTTLHFEWNVIRRRYRRTIWIYSISRLSGLMVMILILVNFYNTSPFNCQAWVSSGWTFAIVGGYGLSSLLIMLRILAIWEKNKVIMAFSTTIWVINLGLQLVGSIKIRAEWVPAAKTCVITNVEISKQYYLVVIQLIADIILLFLMLVGLFRLRRGLDSNQGSFYITSLLWKQGVIWFVIATVAELPLVILVTLDVNDSLSLLPFQPAMAAIVIAATRMYRSLMDSASPSTFYLDEPISAKLQNTEPFRVASPTSKDSSVVQIPSKNQLEVTVHRTFHEEYQNHHGTCQSSPSLDVQFTDKPHKVLGLGDDVEGSDEI